MTIGAYTQLALVETYVDTDGLTKVVDSFRFTPKFGPVGYDTIDLGFPDVREAVQDLPGADGTYDETRYTGARLVTITGKALQNWFGDQPQLGGWDPYIGWNSASWWCSYLAGWASPARRPALYFTDDSGRSRFMSLRGDSFTAPVERGSHAFRSWTMSFKCPSGKIFSFDTSPAATGDGRTRQLIRQSSVSLPGRVYPAGGRTYPRTYPVVIGSTRIDYGGSVAAGFVGNIYTGSQPMQGPRVAVTGPDGTVRSVGLSADYVIPARTVITVDTTARTITGPDGASLEQFKTAPMQWPQLRPGLLSGRVSGVNLIGFTIQSGDPDAYLEVLFQSADLQ